MEKGKEFMERLPSKKLTGDLKEMVDKRKKKEFTPNPLRDYKKLK